jgi:hypothetical protein
LRCKSPTKTGDAAREVALYDAITSTVQACAFTDGTRPVGGAKRGPEVPSVVLTVFGHVEPGECRVRSALERDGMPRSFCFLAPAQPCEGPRSIDSDAFVVAGFLRPNQSLQGSVKTGKGCLVELLSCIGATEASEVPRVYPIRHEASMSDGRQVLG